MKILIVGGTGFIGSNLLDTIPHGIQCTVIARNIPSIKDLRNNINYIAGDVKTFKFKPGHYTHIIHCADSGVTGTKNVLKCKPKKMLFISSGAACYPGTVYSDSKLASEIMVRMAGGTIARCYTFAGPHMQFGGRFAIGNFIHDAFTDQVIKVKGDGRSVRSYLYSGDMAMLLWEVLFHGEPKQIYSVGADEPISMKQLAREIARQVSQRIKKCIIVEIQHGDIRGLAPKMYVPPKVKGFDIPLARLELKDVIARTIDWYVKKYKP